MANPVSGPGGIQMALYAMLVAAQQDRNVSSVILREQDSAPKFEGNGGSHDPSRGQNIDIFA